MFRPIPAIIKFSPKDYQCLQDLCGCVTMVKSHHLWVLIITIIIKLIGGGGFCNVGVVLTGV